MKELKKFKPTLPKAKIEEIIEAPEVWAEEFALNVLETEGYRMIKAKKFGSMFAESLLKEKDGLE